MKCSSAIIAAFLMSHAAIAPAAEAKPAAPFVLAIHGGAGPIPRAEMTPEKEKAHRAALEEALRAGHAVLKNGGASLDAVVAAIEVLEDSPLFNAGRGAVLTADGTGEGAEAFGRQNGATMMPQDYFITEYRKQQLERIRRAQKDQKDKPRSEFEMLTPAERVGTVGAVALDSRGDLAAGTSTGGMVNKKFGRVGDSPIIGAGTFADNQTCAVSATGHGEFFIRGVVAHDIAALIEYKGMKLAEAADLVVMKKLKELGGTGGVIALDRQGNVAMPFNTEGMFRGVIRADGTVEIAIYRE
ncbi:MAG: isoaspartyl peptidase/L-asparaginase [Verrucomicrobia bacterium]|nr:isoaspartyl peptidase/L-asparaginase [Verrucomicrobiota bacterium]